MADIRVRINKKGEKRYFVRIRLRGYPIVTATFSRLTDARRWADKTEDDIRTGRYFKSAEGKKHTVGEMIDRYLTTLAQRRAWYAKTELL